MSTTVSLGWTVSGFVTGEVVTTCNDCWLSPYNVVSWSFTATSTDPFAPAIESVSSAIPGAVIWGSNGASWLQTGPLYATSSGLYYQPSLYSFCFCDTDPVQPNWSHQLLVFDYVNNHGDWFFFYDDDGKFPYTVDLDVAVGQNGLQIATIDTPLPTTLSLFSTGLAGLFLLSRRRRRNG